LGLGFAIVAGLGFGGFFILIAQVGPGPVFTPLILARGVTFLAALAMLLRQRPPLPQGLRAAVAGHPMALLAGVLDAGGNVFYLFATQFTRLDVAAVLASLYPVTTVVLAHLLLRERAGVAQWAGVGLCVVAVVLISG
jgi:drug/metabolite transporter (DMT)-like permease